MALTACRECGHQVSDTAQTCPNCGARVKPKSRALKWFMGGVGALVVAFFALGAFLVSTRTPDEVFIAEAREHVAAQLKNPDTARFGTSFVVRKQVEKNGAVFDAVALCGLVDGKNAFGAYAGGTRYVVGGFQGGKIVTIVGVDLEDGDRRATVKSYDKAEKATIFEELYWNEKCVDAAHPPTYSAQH